MSSRQVTAVQVCGAATLVVVLVVATLVTRVLGIEGLPSVRLTLGLAVLVSFAAFLVANISNVDAARAVCVGSIALICVVAALRVYQVVVTHTAFGVEIVDGLFATIVACLLVPLCKSVFDEKRDASTS